MIKITIAIVVLLAAGVVWLRAQWARSKNSSAANEIINDLKSGKYVIESYAETLGILISTKPFPPVFDPASAKNKLQEMTGKQIHEKFRQARALSLPKPNQKTLLPVTEETKRSIFIFPAGSISMPTGRRIKLISGLLFLKIKIITTCWKICLLKYIAA